ncbi:MAG: hypothetical protein PWR08_1902, partial [Thermoanaerobacterium sp.]|nr:hypothetical protein [Thermoanaerobacterium sp.]
MLISIFSPKGGVGKTTLTLSLAECMSKEKKTCAVEFDFSPGDFPATLDVDKNKNILKAINFGINETLQRPYKQNFDVIAGGYPDTHEKIDSDKLNKLIDELVNEYEVAIFDIQPGLIKNSVDILKRSDKILIIMEDNIPVSVRTARILNWGMQNNAIDINKVNIVVNMAKGNLKNIPNDVVKYVVPYLGNKITFHSNVLLKQMSGLMDVILERDKKGLFKKSQKSVDVKDIERFVQEKIQEILEDDTSEELNITIDNNENVAVIQSEEKEACNLVYIKTNIESLNNVLKNEISNNENIGGITDDFDKCSVAIVSANSKEEIDKLVGSRKSLVLFLSPNMNDLREYALKKGVKHVYAGECSISDIVYVTESMLEKSYSEDSFNSSLNNVNEMKSEVQQEERQEIKSEKQGIVTDTRLEINPEIKQPDAMTL